MEAQKLYEIILRTANSFLHNAKHFSIEVLNERNPSYEEVAEMASTLAELVWILADDFDPMLQTKALEYATIMKEMGKAITNCNAEHLNRLTEILDRKPLL